MPTNKLFRVRAPTADRLTKLQFVSTQQIINPRQCDVYYFLTNDFNSSEVPSTPAGKFCFKIASRVRCYLEWVFRYRNWSVKFPLQFPIRTIRIQYLRSFRCTDVTSRLPFIIARTSWHDAGCIALINWAFTRTYTSASLCHCRCSYSYNVHVMWRHLHVRVTSSSCEEHRAAIQFVALQRFMGWKDIQAERAITSDGNIAAPLMSHDERLRREPAMEGNLNVGKLI